RPYGSRIHSCRRAFMRPPPARSRVPCFFFFSSRRRHTRFSRDWSSDVCSSDLKTLPPKAQGFLRNVNRRRVSRPLRRGRKAQSMGNGLIFPHRVLLRWGDGEG